MFDRIEKFNKSTIQHGKNNDRIYLMYLDKEDNDVIFRKLDQLAAQNGYTKIVAKVPDWAHERFIRQGYDLECSIPAFYQGQSHVHFMSRFKSASRRTLSKEETNLIEKNINIANSKKNSATNISLPQGFIIRQLAVEDIPSLVDLYKAVFPAYPFPIFDPAYIAATMADNIQYFGVFEDRRLIATSSAEIDHQAQNAEMTDFARHPSSKSGLNLSSSLLTHMEHAMKEQDIKTLYTIARANSAGMNTTFARSDYTLAGTLINNTLISTGIESMNVWYKTD